MSKVSVGDRVYYKAKNAFCRVEMSSGTVEKVQGEKVYLGRKRWVKIANLVRVLPGSKMSTTKKITVRMPAKLHREVFELARQSDMTPSEWIRAILFEAAGMKNEELPVGVAALSKKRRSAQGKLAAKHRWSGASDGAGG